MFAGLSSINAQQSPQSHLSLQQQQQRTANILNAANSHSSLLNDLLQQQEVQAVQRQHLQQINRRIPNNNNNILPYESNAAAYYEANASDKALGEILDLLFENVPPEAITGSLRSNFVLSHTLSVI